VLSEAEYIAVYCKARGIPTPDDATYSFCMALSLFRMAAILAGVAARGLAGNASSKSAAQASTHPALPHLRIPQNECSVWMRYH